MPLTQIQLAALDAAAIAAVACETACRLPADLTIAQWADESGWGAHQPGNNCFGIKAVAGQTSETLPTAEYTRSNPIAPVIEGQAFETFATLTDCFNRHAQLITTGKPYAACWAQFEKDKSTTSLIQRVAKSYATDPSYALKLLRIRQMPEVARALIGARLPLVNIIVPAKPVS